MRKYLRDAWTLPGAAVRAWHADGVAGVWQALRRRTLDRLYHRWTALVLEFDVIDATLAQLPAGIVVQPWNGDDWSRLTPLANERMRARFASLAARGRHCLVAWRGPEPVGYVWLSTVMELELDRCFVPLPPDAIYVGDAYVTRCERGKGIGRGMEAAAGRHARAQGFRRVWAVIEARNHASRCAAAAAVSHEPRVIGRVTVSKWGRRWSMRFTPGAEAGAPGATELGRLGPAVEAVTR